MHKLKFLTLSIILVISLSLAALSFPASARPLDATAPGLGTAGSFAVLGGSAVTNTGSSVLTGDLGVSPGSAISGFPPGTFTGTKHAGDATAALAQGAVTAAYNTLSQPCPNDLTGQDLGGLTLTPGVYCFSSSAQLTGALTLNAQGDPNAVWIFQMGSTLTTASNSSVGFSNAGSGPGCNVFWQVGSSATLGTTTSFVGNILAVASITMNTGANLAGRALARNGAVTLDTNNIAPVFCAAAVSTATTPATPTANPTATMTPHPTATPQKPTATLLPVVTGLPGTGGGPIRNEDFPWSLVIVGGFSAIVLLLGVRAYRSTYRPKQ